MRDCVEGEKEPQHIEIPHQSNILWTANGYRITLKKKVVYRNNKKSQTMIMLSLNFRLDNFYIDSFHSLSDAAVYILIRFNSNVDRSINRHSHWKYFNEETWNVDRFHTHTHSYEDWRWFDRRNCQNEYVWRWSRKRAGPIHPKIDKASEICGGRIARKRSKLNTN